jgi:hypothetical protein
MQSGFIHRGLCLIGVLLGQAAAARAAGAQLRVELEPVGGVYTGFGSFPRPASPGPFQFPDTLTQGTSIALGGQVTVWPTDRVGIRLFAMTAGSEVGADQRDLLNREPVPARVTVTGLEAVVELRALPSGTRIHAAAGPAIVSRSGEFYRDFDGLRDVGLSLGVGSQLRVSSRLRLQGDVRALLYSLALTDGAGLRYPSAFQTDLLAGLGLVLSLGGSDVEEE